jgi:8-oxo-dGTP diphosphatase
VTRGSVVVAAAIVAGAPPRLLAARRSHPPELAGLWELPGGKVEAGESEPQALARECREELGVDVTVGGRAAGDVPTASGAVLRTYWASVRVGSPRPLAHAELRWLDADGLDDVVWLPADAPIVAALRPALRSTG